MNDDKKIVKHTEQAAATTYELVTPSTSNPLELTREIGDWVSGLPLDLRTKNSFIFDVKGKGVFLDVEKATVEIRPVEIHFEIIPV